LIILFLFFNHHLTISKKNLFFSRLEWQCWNYWNV